MILIFEKYKTTRLRQRGIKKYNVSQKSKDLYTMKNNIVYDEEENFSKKLHQKNGDDCYEHEKIYIKR